MSRSAIPLNLPRYSGSTYIRLSSAVRFWGSSSGQRAPQATDFPCIFNRRKTGRSCDVGGIPASPPYFAITSCLWRSISSRASGSSKDATLTSTSGGEAGPSGMAEHIDDFMVLLLMTRSQIEE